ncbi:MAG: hypothetical protein ABL904_07075 [Hyphomicrobiaceae bacterium]
MANATASTLDPLILDLVEWVAGTPRTYADMLDAWRTSCPRLTVWEEAEERGFVTRKYVEGDGAMVHATLTGHNFLKENGR